MPRTWKHFFFCVLAYAPGLILAVIIFLLSDMSHPPIPRWLRFANSDKLIHACTFFSMSFLICMATTVRRKIFDLGVIVETFILVAGYGVFDELHQSHVPLRSPSVYDWLADSGGTLLGIFVFGVVQSQIKKLYKKRHPVF